MQCLTREGKPRRLRDLWHRPIMMVWADALEIGDIIHECDSPELRGIVIYARPGDWSGETVMFVRTAEDGSSRRIAVDGEVLITRGATEIMKEAK